MSSISTFQLNSGKGYLGIFLCLFFFHLNSLAQDSLTIEDTRSISTIPSSYRQSLTPSFKTASSVGITPSVGTYVTVIGLRGWVDNSGGKSEELAFTDDNNVYVRSGFAPTWEGWRKVITENDNNNVGIGTISATNKLQVVQSNTFAENDVTTYACSIAQNGGNLGIGTYGSGAVLQSFNIQPMYLNPIGNNVIICGSSLAKVGIGTNNPQSTLAVAGNVTARQVTVTQTGWSDFVFDSTYLRMSLPHVESFIRENKHLPDVPSGQQVAKDGLDLGAMQQLQMQKIEELTLYAIDADKRIKEQDSTIALLQERLEKLEQKINDPGH